MTHYELQLVNNNITYVNPTTLRRLKVGSNVSNKYLNYLLFENDSNLKKNEIIYNKLQKYIKKM